MHVLPASSSRSPSSISRGQSVGVSLPTRCPSVQYKVQRPSRRARNSRRPVSSGGARWAFEMEVAGASLFWPLSHAPRAKHAPTNRPGKVPPNGRRFAVVGITQNPLGQMSMVTLVRTKSATRIEIDMATTLRVVALPTPSVPPRVLKPK